MPGHGRTRATEEHGPRKNTGHGRTRMAWLPDSGKRMPVNACPEGGGRVEFLADQ